MAAQTDNSFLADKVALRLAHLPATQPLHVLDCYAGAGYVWKAVRKLTTQPIEVLPIDQQYGYGFHLPGNNMLFLPSLDLSRFHVVDLDAYGVPYEQMEVLFDRGYRGTVFATFAQAFISYGHVPEQMLGAVGFTQQMIGKCPTLFAKRGWQYFCEWLASKGVTEIWHRSKERKHYLGFEMNGQVSLDVEIAGS